MEKKWIWIGLAVAILAGGLYYYFSTKDEKSLGEKGEEFEPIEDSVGAVESISELSEKCKKVHKGWKAWMISRPDSTWTLQLKEVAKTKNTTLNVILDRTFIASYNKGSYDEKCA